MSYSKSGKLNVAAAQAGMDPKTARKYLRNDTLPSEPMPDRHWRTREDIFGADLTRIYADVTRIYADLTRIYAD